MKVTDEWIAQEFARRKQWLKNFPHYQRCGRACGARHSRLSLLGVS